MLLLYNLAVRSYALLVRLAALVVPKAAAWVAGRRGLLAHIQARMAGTQGPRAWMHCASLGEFEQGRPLLEALRRQRPELTIVLTFFSPSGYEVRRDWPGADYVFYLPLDTAAHARAFLDAVRPELALFVKYEFWHHYLRELRRRGITTVAVSAIFRPGQVFFQPWGGFFRRMLGNFTHIFTQNQASADLLRGAGLTHVSVAGDTRFDTVVATASARPRDLPVLDEFVSDWAPVLIIGSSWTDDLAVLTPLMARYQDELRFIVAPHEISEANLLAVEAALPGRSLRYSRAAAAGPEAIGRARLLLIDNVGLLSQLYRYGHFAYIGGAFGKGLHNTLEAAAFGLPLFFGPAYAKFQEAVSLVALGCAFPVETTEELQAAFGRLFYEEETRLRVQDAALDYVHEQGGATNRIMEKLRITNYELPQP